MNRAFSKSALRSCGLIVLLLVSCFWRLNATGLTDEDEGLYGTASRQMLASHDWIVPRIGDAVRYAKPPLFYWTQAPSIAVFGATPFGARLPAALAAFLTCLLLWWWGRRRGQEAVGQLAAAIYALSPLTVVLCRQGIIDCLLGLCLTFTVICWIEAWSGSRRAYLGMALGAGLATLAKSTPGLILPLGAAALWLLWRRDGRELRRVPWVAATLVFLAVAAPWHILMEQRTPHFFQEYFVSNQLKRAAGTKWGHHQPVWYYLPIGLAAMLPWSLLVPRAWLGRMRQSQSSERGSWDACLAMWGLWALTVVVFYSISKSKLPTYIGPALPAFALLVADQLVRWHRKTAEKPATENAMVLGTCAVLGAACLALGLYGSGAFGGARMGSVGGATGELLTGLAPWTLAGGALLLGSFVYFGWTLVGPKRLVATAVTFNLILVGVGMEGFHQWGLTQVEPLQNLVRSTLPNLDEGDHLVIYGFLKTRDSLRFVADHTSQVSEIVEPSSGQLEQLVTRYPKGYVVTPRETLLPKLPVMVSVEASTRKWLLYRWTKRVGGINFWGQPVQ